MADDRGRPLRRRAIQNITEVREFASRYRAELIRRAVIEAHGIQPEPAQPGLRVMVAINQTTMLSIIPTGAALIRRARARHRRALR